MWNRNTYSVSMRVLRKATRKFDRIEKKYKENPQLDEIIKDCIDDHPSIYIKQVQGTNWDELNKAMKRDLVSVSYDILEERNKWPEESFASAFVSHAWITFFISWFKAFPTSLSQKGARITLEGMRMFYPRKQYGLPNVLFSLLCTEYDQLFELVYSLYPKVREEETTKRLEIFKEELVEKACHPMRVEWWMDFEEYRELMEMM